MKLNRLLSLALLAALSCRADEVGHLLLMMSQPDGKPELYRADQLVTNIFDYNNAPQWSYYALCQDGAWTKHSQAAVWVWNNRFSGSNLAFPVMIATNTSYGLLTFSTNGVFTNAQYGWTRTSIPLGKSALIGNGFLSPFSHDTAATLLGCLPLDAMTTETNLTLFSQWTLQVVVDTAVWRHSYVTNSGVVTNGFWPYQWARSSSNIQWRPYNPSFWPCTGLMIGNSLQPDGMDIYITGSCYKGTVTNSIPAGWSVCSPINGQGGPLLALNFPFDTNTVVKRWDRTNGNWLVYCATNASPGDALTPPTWGAEPEPTLNPGEAFMCYQTSAKDWVQTGASDPVFTTPNTSTNLTLAVTSATSSSLALSLLNSTSNAVYVVESRTNVATGSWTALSTNTSTNATSTWLPAVQLADTNAPLFLRARAQ